MHLAKVPGGDRELDSEITGPKVHHSPHSLVVLRETLGLTRMRNHNLGAPPPNIHRLFLHGERGSSASRSSPPHTSGAVAMLST